MRTTVGRVLVGAVTWWVVGALPFLLTGLRLPPQNLWHTSQPPETMPLVALPFNQYFIAFLVAITVIGGVAAALTGMASPSDERGPAVRAALGGGALAAVVSLSQTGIVVWSGLERSGRATVYFGAIVAVIVLGSVLGLVVGHAVVRGRPGTRAVAIAFVSVLLNWWLGMILLVQRSIGSELWQAVDNAIPWVTAVVAGIGLAFCPPRSRRAAGAWVMALVVLWVGPALIAALGYVAGSRAMLAHTPPREWLEAGWDVFRAALVPGNRAIWPFVLTILLGLLGLRPAAPAAPDSTGASDIPGAPDSAPEDRTRTVDP